MKKIHYILLTLVLILSVSCAGVEPNVAECLTGHTYGFWGGLWHGTIAPISFLGSLFMDDVAIYATNNNGNWYVFGFAFGAGIIGFSSGSTKKK